MNPKKFPHIPEDLLLALGKLFPDRVPMSGDITPQEIGKLQGEQRVIQFLRTTFERQNKTVLEN